MIITTVGEFLDPNCDLPEELDSEYHCIYLVLDLDRLPFYLGKAFDQTGQLRSHLLPGNSLGDLVARQRPESFTWPVEFYNPQDCELVVARQYPDDFALFRKDMHDEDRVEFALKRGYQALLKQLRPCFNYFANPNPQPLPEKYQYTPTLQTGYESPLENLVKEKKIKWEFQFSGPSIKRKKVIQKEK